MRGAAIARAVDKALRAANQGTVSYIHVTDSGEEAHTAEAAFPRLWNGLLEGMVVQVGEVSAMVAAARLGDVEPNARGRLVLNGRHYPVVRVDPIPAGDATAAWIIQAGGRA